MIAAVDSGGSNTDVILARRDGAVAERVTLPWLSVSDEKSLRQALDGAAVPWDALTAIGVTGGRHQQLPERLGALPVVHVDEMAAIARGAQLCASVSNALVMSMGTGTAFVAVGAGAPRHLGGTAIGGGTVMGLSRLLLGVTDAAEIGALAGRGDRQAVDLSVGDVVGGAAGIIPPHLTASHFGKAARPDLAPPSRADIAAGLIEMIGQVLGRLGLMAARTVGESTVVLTGHVADWPGIRDAISRVAGAFGGDIIVPPNPGFATAMGVLAHLFEAVHD